MQKNVVLVCSTPYGILSLRPVLGVWFTIFTDKTKRRENTFKRKLFRSQSDEGQAIIEGTGEVIW